MTLVDPEWEPDDVEASLGAANRGEPSVSAVLYVREHLATGARPVLLVGDDHDRYWAKWPGNPHGALSLAHEVIVTGLGQALRAPVAGGTLMHVDADLVAGRDIDGVRLPSGTWFASRVVSGLEATQLERASRDGNPQRIPRYLALWSLCLGFDAQFIYEAAEDDRVWSIDHGLWFDSGEGDWTEEYLASMQDGGWPEPDWQGSHRVDDSEYHAAADAVERLSRTAVAKAVGRVPVEWGIPNTQLTALARFVHGRRPAVANQLRLQAARTKGGRKP